MPVTTCICIKYGKRYGPEYPNRLYAGLVRHATSDIRLVCMTDDRVGLHPRIEILPIVEEPFHAEMFAAMRRLGLQAPFRKVSLFRPGLIPGHHGPLVVLDIDVVIVGDIVPIRDFAPGKIAMRREWRAREGFPALGHGSVEKIEPARHAYLYETMAADPAAALAYGQGSEQNYTSRLAMDSGDFAALPDVWIASFKYDCRPPKPLNMFLPPRLPSGARVVCFHGRPKMEEAVDGHWDGLNTTRRSQWLRKAWIGPDI